MNRRSFLYTIGSAASLNAADRNRVRIAMIGASHSHAAGKLRVLQESQDFEVAGLWEPDAALASKYAVPRLTLEDVWRDKSIVAVAVESDVRDHADHALAALRAGKHVHLEKPPATTARAMRDIVREARDRKLLVQSGYMWRYHPGLDRIIEAVRQGCLGEVFQVRGLINTLIPDARRPEWARFPGGQMFELGSHLVDVVVRLLGKPLKVTPFLREHGTQRDGLKDNTIAVMEYGRALAVIQSATLQPSAHTHRSFEVAGTNGTAMLRPIEGGSLTVHLDQAKGGFARGVNTVQLPPYRRYVADLAEFASAVRGETRLKVSLEEELLIHEAVLAASGMA